MHRWLISVPLLGALAVAGLGWGLAPSASADTAPRTVYESVFPMPATLEAPHGDSTLVHYVVEFPPGGQTPYHSHPYGCVATMVEGQIQNRFRTSGSVAVAGKTLVTPKDQIGRHTNDSSVNRAVYFAACFAPNADGFAVVDQKADPPIIGPNVLFAPGMSVSDLPSQFDLVQRVTDFTTGAASGELRANGTGMLSVLSGQVTIRTDGRSEVLRSGDTFYTRPGRTFSVTNNGTSNARVVSTMTVAAGVSPDSALR